MMSKSQSPQPINQNPQKLIGDVSDGANGLGRRFFQETPYGLSVEGHLENTARLNTSFDNQGWLNAKNNVGLPCPGKPRPTWPPHWIYPMPRSNETEYVRYPGTETRVPPFVPQISPDFVPPNNRFNIQPEDYSDSDSDSLSPDEQTTLNDVPIKQTPTETASTLLPSTQQSPQSQLNQRLTTNPPPLSPSLDNKQKQNQNTIVLTSAIIGLILLLVVVGSMISFRNRT